MSFPVVAVLPGAVLVTLEPEEKSLSNVRVVPQEKGNDLTRQV